METSLIEQLDKMRYNLLKWGTIGFGIWFGTFILTEFPFDSLILESMPYVRLLGNLILIVSVIRFLKLRRRRELNWDRKMKKALEGELHQLNLLKSFRNGFFVVIGTTLIFFTLTLFSAIPALLIIKITLYFGVLTVVISKLIYNRD